MLPVSPDYPPYPDYADELRQEEERRRAADKFPAYVPLILYIGEKEVRFQRDSFADHLLTLLFYEHPYVTGRYGWDEVYEYIEGSEPDIDPKGAKNRFYVACNSINRRIYQKTGFADFLLIERYSARINPEYLGEPKFQV